MAEELPKCPECGRDTDTYIEGNEPSECTRCIQLMIERKQVKVIYNKKKNEIRVEKNERTKRTDRR